MMPLDQLPDELLLNVAGFLNVPGLNQRIQTAKRYYHTLQEQLYIEAVLGDDIIYNYLHYLALAALSNQVPAFRTLLARTKDVDNAKIDLKGLNPPEWHLPHQPPSTGTLLHLLCSLENSNNEEMIKLVLERGANPEVKVSIGWTPLHVASLYNNIGAMDLLLKAGVDVNAVIRDWSAYSALTIAVDADNLRAVERLVQEGVHAGLNDVNDSPLFAAFDYGNAEMVRMLVKTLTDHPDDVHIFETAGPEEVFGNQHPEILRLLLRHKSGLAERKNSSS